MFVVPGDNPDPKKTANALSTITGSKVTILEIRPYVSNDTNRELDGKARYVKSIFESSNKAREFKLN